MKKIIISLTSNYILGIFSQIPLIYGFILINGGISIFGEPLDPTNRELFLGLLVFLTILMVLLIVNYFIYKKFKSNSDDWIILYIVGVISYIFGVSSFAVGIYAPDIFNIM